jgi:hypothetical protein
MKRVLALIVAASVAFGIAQATPVAAEAPEFTVAPEYASGCSAKIVTATVPDYGYSVCGTLTGGSWQQVVIGCRNALYTIYSQRTGPKVYSSGTRSKAVCPQNATFIVSASVRTG